MLVQETLALPQVAQTQVSPVSVAQVTAAPTSLNGQSAAPPPAAGFSRQVIAANDTVRGIQLGSDKSPDAQRDGGGPPVKRDDFLASDLLRDSASGQATLTSKTLNSAALGLPLADYLKGQSSAGLTWEAATVKQSAFTSELVKLREDINDAVVLDKTIVATSAALSTSVSIGYVIWILRGGVLLSSLLAALPAWRSIDPLPVLANLKGRNLNEGEDDSLQNLLKKARKTNESADNLNEKTSAEVDNSALHSATR